MPTAEQRLERAQRARANGAKSRGPKTTAGLQRARTASLKTGLYATSVSGICPESNAAFLPFHAELLAEWHPKTGQAELLVNQLITALWDIRLFQNGYTIYMSELVDTLAATSPNTGDPAKLIIEAQKLAMNTYGGTVARFQARLSACFRTRDRIARELRRLQKQYAYKRTVPEGIENKQQAQSSRGLRTSVTPGPAGPTASRSSQMKETSDTNLTGKP